MFAQVKDPAVLDAALALCRGTYQRDLLMGREAISGSTLKGKARSYSGRYRQSAQQLLSRCRNAGLPITEEVQDHNRRVLVIG